MPVVQSNVLLLGMVFSTETEPKRGQEFRDRVRCSAVAAHGYRVRTLDNKHSDAEIANHCCANFVDSRRMLKALSSKWANESYDHIILDYFFSPVGVLTY
jgi:hypothetical protein